MASPDATSGAQPPRRADPRAPQTYKGEHLGLPATGSGSIAPTGPRLGAFLVDAIASGLIAALFIPHHGGDAASQLPQLWAYVPFAVDYLGGILIAGRTLGMYLFGLRLVRVDRVAAIGPGRVLARTAMLCLLVPALVFDRDGRGMHDKLTDTAVVRN